MSSDQSIFKFELNETLYFESGQELEELRGISLDPEISIQTLDDYISIRGVIELKGNYVKSALTENDEEELSDFYVEAKRYIENVVDTNETEAEFAHRFPVEISVPTYRVTDLDDVTVSVDSFDYELPNNSQLKLFSTIAIHGINQDVSREEEVVDEVSEIEDTSVIEEETESEEETEREEDRIDEPVSLENEEKESFEFDIKHNQEDASVPEVELPPHMETPTLAEAEERDETDEHEEFIEEEQAEEEKKEGGRWAFKTESQSLSEFFAKKDETNVEMEVEEEIVTEIEEDFGGNLQTEIVYENTGETRDDKDITYLSDIFRDTEEQQYTKMRLCIVQKDDTIESISERFEISPLQVIKQNQLEEDFDVSEGQILYIPYKK